MIRGRAAHAGLNPGEGVSAVLELSHRIQRLFSMNDAARGVSVNVGTIDGGMSSNVVAPVVRARVDVRVPTSELGARVEAAIRGLQPVESTIEHRESPAASTIRRSSGGRATARCGSWPGGSGAIGQDLEEAAVGGASDGNTISVYTATLDGLGAVGDGAHASHEHVQASKLAGRAALVALLLAAPIGGPEPAGADAASTGARGEDRRD